MSKSKCIKTSNNDLIRYHFYDLTVISSKGGTYWGFHEKGTSATGDFMKKVPTATWDLRDR